MNIINFATSSNPILSLQGLWVILGTAISLLIMFLIVTYFFYFPTKEFLDRKEKHIQDEIDDAEKRNSNAEQNFNKSEAELKDASLKKGLIISEGKNEGNVVREQIISGAKQEAKVIYEDTTAVANREALKIKSEAEQEIAKIAILATEKILGKEIDKDTNTKLVDELINKIK